MKRKSELLKRISEIEQQLRDLKLEVQNFEEDTQERTSTKRFFEIGDSVIIINPRFGQGSEGIVTKANPNTGWITVQTDRGKVRRQHFNLALRD